MGVVPGRRVAVFIDYQNCYGIARREFCDAADPGIRGHLLPRALAHFLAGKAGGAYELVYCGVYCGIASSEKEPRGFAARRKQAAAWEKAGATVVMRPLRYQGWPDERPREKGVDVRLAIDVVAKALAGEYDVAIIASCDTDLAPAVELLLELKAKSGTPDVELIAWEGRQSKIGVTGQHLTYREVTESDFEAVSDPVDYNL
jgi:NYN domain